MRLGESHKYRIQNTEPGTKWLCPPCYANLPEEGEEEEEEEEVMEYELLEEGGGGEGQD